jgi:ribonuclease P protein component
LQGEGQKGEKNLRFKRMLPKQNRLKKEKDFQAVIRAGRPFREGLLILKYRNNGGEEIRFGISVSKKVSLKATVRNKVRRTISAVLPGFMPKIKKGKDIIFFTVPGIEKKSLKEITEMVGGLLRKAVLM